MSETKPVRNKASYAAEIRDLAYEVDYLYDASDERPTGLNAQRAGNYQAQIEHLRKLMEEAPE